MRKAFSSLVCPSHLTTILLVSLLTLTWAKALAQAPTSVGLGSVPSVSYAVSDFDSVNLGNGNLVVSIPIRSFPQRGALQLQAKLVANAWQWNSVPAANNTSTVITSGGGATLLWDGFWGGGVQSYAFGGDCTNGSSGFLSYTMYIFGTDGSSHSEGFRSSGAGFTGSGICPRAPYITETGDGSDLSMVSRATIYNGSNNASIYDRHGVQYPVTNGASSVVTGTQSTDLDGNAINGTTDSVGRSIAMIPTFYSQWASAKPSVSTNSCKGPLPNLYAYAWNIPGPNGQTSNYVLCYTRVPLKTNFQISGMSEYVGDNSDAVDIALQSLVFPNGQAWVFEYGGVVDKGVTVNYGDITRIDMPSGGYIRYSYITGSPAGSSGPARIVSTRTINANDGTPDRVWTYSWPAIAATGNNKHLQVVVTDPAGNDSAHWYKGMNEVEMDSYTGSYTSGTLLQTTSTDYLYSSGGGYATNIPLPYQFAPAFPIRVTTTFPNGLTSKVETDYDSGMGGSNPMIFGKPVTQRYYDFGQGTPGALLRRTTYSYVALNNPAYLANNLIDLVQSETTYDGSGNQVAQVSYGYDEYPTVAGQNGSPTSPAGTPLGHQTSVSIWNKGGSPIVSTTTYNADGMPVIKTDPLMTKTQVTYECGGSLPSTVITAYQSTTLMPETSVVKHDCATGLPLTSQTPNDLAANRSGSTITYDYMMNVLTQTAADGGTVSYNWHNYSLPLTVTTTVTANPSPAQITTLSYDGFLRVTKQSMDSAPGGAVISNTSYDGLGRTASVSNPYVSTNDPTYGTTTYLYDGLGRTLSLTHSMDGSTQSETYLANVTTTMDEAGRKWMKTSDALGRLIKVLEPDGSTNIGSTPTLETDYQYDALSNLTRVDQWGGPVNTPGERVRLFQYDSLSRLTNACNPETISSGSTCTGSGPWSAVYTYDSNGNVQTKKDARALTVSYSYDALNRLASKTYAVPSPAPTDYATTPPVTFTYDQTTFNGLTISNGIGHLTGMTDGPGKSAWSYDAMGRVVKIERTTNGSTYTTADTYDLAGDVTKINSYTGTNLNYNYDSAGRQISAIDPDLNINFVTGVTYAPPGEIAGMVLGYSSSFTGLTLANQYDRRLRLQLTSANTTAATLQSLSYSYDADSNIQGIVNNVNTAHSQSFQYDNMNRLAMGRAGTLWGDTYQYDAFGNLYQFNQISGTGTGQSTQLIPTINNQVTGGALTYDAGGNMSADAMGTAYYYDAENRIAKTGSTIYSYDGNSNRVAKTSGSANRTYWYGAEGEILNEFDVTGGNNVRNIYLAGALRARRYASGAIDYVAGDHLGSARIVVNASGALEDNSDYYPFGQVANYSSVTSGDTYKFTGKERDAESGFDYFGARYMSSSMGRFTSPDWSDINDGPPDAVAFGDVSDPQSLNLYGYVQNNPLSNVDPDGHDCIDTSDFTRDGTVTITRGDSCANSLGPNGTYVNGTVDANSLTVSVKGNTTFGYSFASYDGQNGGGGVIAQASPYGPLDGPANRSALGLIGNTAGGVVNGVGSFELSIIFPWETLAAQLLSSKGPNGAQAAGISRKPGKLGMSKGTDALRRENKMARDITKALKLNEKEAEAVHDLLQEGSQQLQRPMTYSEAVEYIGSVLAKIPK